MIRKTKYQFFSFRCIILVAVLFSLTYSDLHSQSSCQRRKKTKFYYIISVPGVGINYNTEMFSAFKAPADLRTVPVYSEYTDTTGKLNNPINDSIFQFGPISYYLRGSLVLGLRVHESHFKLGVYYNQPSAFFSRSAQVSRKYPSISYDEYSSYYGIPSKFGSNMGAYFRFIPHQKYALFLEYGYDMLNAKIENGWYFNNETIPNKTYEFATFPSHILKAGFESISLCKADYFFEINITFSMFGGVAIPAGSVTTQNYPEMRIDPINYYFGGLSMELFFLFR